MAAAPVAHESKPWAAVSSELGHTVQPAYGGAHESTPWAAAAAVSSELGHTVQPAYGGAHESTPWAAAAAVSSELGHTVQPAYGGAHESTPWAAAAAGPELGVTVTRPADPPPEGRERALKGPPSAAAAAPAGGGAGGPGGARRRSGPAAPQLTAEADHGTAGSRAGDDVSEVTLQLFLEAADRALGISWRRKGKRVLVKEVHPGSPAEAAGCRPGDELFELGGHSVTAPGDLQPALAAAAAAERPAVVRLRVRRRTSTPRAPPTASGSATASTAEPVGHPSRQWPEQLPFACAAPPGSAVQPSPSTTPPPAPDPDPAPDPALTSAPAPAPAPTPAAATRGPATPPPSAALSSTQQGAAAAPRQQQTDAAHSRRSPLSPLRSPSASSPAAGAAPARVTWGGQAPDWPAAPQPAAGLPQWAAASPLPAGSLLPVRVEELPDSYSAVKPLLSRRGGALLRWAGFARAGRRKELRIVIVGATACYLFRPADGSPCACCPLAELSEVVVCPASACCALRRVPQGDWALQLLGDERARAAAPAAQLGAFEVAVRSGCVAARGGAAGEVGVRTLHESISFEELMDRLCLSESVEAAPGGVVLAAAPLSYVHDAPLRAPLQLRAALQHLAPPRSPPAPAPRLAGQGSTRARSPRHAAGAPGGGSLLGDPGGRPQRAASPPVSSPVLPPAAAASSTVFATADAAARQRSPFWQRPPPPALRTPPSCSTSAHAERCTVAAAEDAEYRAAAAAARATAAESHWVPQPRPSAPVPSPATPRTAPRRRVVPAADSPCSGAGGDAATREAVARAASRLQLLEAAVARHLAPSPDLLPRAPSRGRALSPLPSGRMLPSPPRPQPQPQSPQSAAAAVAAVDAASRRIVQLERLVVSKLTSSPPAAGRALGAPESRQVSPPRARQERPPSPPPSPPPKQRRRLSCPSCFRRPPLRRPSAQRPQEAARPPAHPQQRPAPAAPEATAEGQPAGRQLSSARPRRGPSFRGHQKDAASEQPLDWDESRDASLRGRRRSDGSVFIDELLHGGISLAE
eukprot:TRINITY_DN17749_c0_g1_i4.p1 TRINITY_DN17749_c0_g1~~TRINITY_DN17749_c0_g1_i4.p1  ORF type:complete len:1063 (+),score=247.79 TRINITY_DN17749_c0_g1_i4:82-3189(+)